MTLLLASTASAAAFGGAMRLEHSTSPFTFNAAVTAPPPGTAAGSWDGPGRAFFSGLDGAYVVSHNCFGQYGTSNGQQACFYVLGGTSASSPTQLMFSSIIGAGMPPGPTDPFGGVTQNVHNSPIYGLPGGGFLAANGKGWNNSPPSCPTIQYRYQQSSATSWSTTPVVLASCPGAQANQWKGAEYLVLDLTHVVRTNINPALGDGATFASNLAWAWFDMTGAGFAAVPSPPPSLVIPVADVKQSPSSTPFDWIDDLGVPGAASVAAVIKILPSGVFISFMNRTGAAIGAPGPFITVSSTVCFGYATIARSVTRIGSTNLVVVPWECSGTAAAPTRITVYARLVSITLNAVVGAEFTLVSNPTAVTATYSRLPDVFSLSDTTFGAAFQISYDLLTYSNVMRAYSIARPDLSPFPMPVTGLIVVEYLACSSTYVEFPNALPRTHPSLGAMGLSTGVMLDFMVHNAPAPSNQNRISWSPLSANLTLNAAACAKLGTPAFNLSCLVAALSNQTLVHNGMTIVLPAGTWVGCPAAGVLLAPAVLITGEAAGGTVINCGGSGRAFLIDGPAINASSLRRVSSAPAAQVAGQFQAALTHLTITGCAAAVGGCVLVNATHISGPPVLLESLTLTGTATGGGGGGLALIDTVDAILSGVTVTGSQATSLVAGAGYGGGILIRYTIPSGALPLAASYAVGLLLEAVTVSGCTAAAGGGGMAIIGMPSDLPSFVLRSVDISSCCVGCGDLAPAVSSSPFWASGGGLLVASSTLPMLGPGVTLSGNTNALGAGGGLALVDAAGSTVIVGLTCLGNMAGVPGSASAMPADGGCAVLARRGVATMTATLRSALLRGNTAQGNGGALAITEASLTLANMTMVANSAAQNGGALSVVVRSVFPPTIVGINNASISDCAADKYGGGIYNAGGQMTLSTVGISGCSVGIGGGGLTVAEPGATTMAGNASASRIVGNSAALVGGGVFLCLASAECGTVSCTASALSLAHANTVSFVNAIGVSVSGNTAQYGPQLGSDAVSIGYLPSGPPLLSSYILFPSLSPFSALPLLQSFDVFGAPVMPLGSDVIGLYVSVASTAIEIAGRPSCSPTFNAAAGALEPCTIAPNLFPLAASVVGVPTALTLRLSASTCVQYPVPLTVTLLACPGTHVLLPDPDFNNGLSCALTCEPGSVFTAASGSQLESCSVCEPGTFFSAPQHRSTVCQLCGLGQYSYANSSRCFACPSGGDCGNGSFVLARPQQWWPNGDLTSFSSRGVHLTSFLRCDTAQACPGGPVYSKCGRGYRKGGFLCDHCDSGWAKLGIECRECWPFWLSALVSITIIVIIFAAAAFVILRVTRTVQVSPGGVAAGPRRRTLRIQIAKSIVNHLQSLGLVMSLRAEQQALAQTVLGTLGSLGGPNLGVFSFGCLHHWSFVQIAWLTVSLPPVVMMITPIAHYLAMLYNRGKARRAQRPPQGGAQVDDSQAAADEQPRVSAVKRELQGSLGRSVAIVLFILYPSVVTTLLRVFQCRNFFGQPHPRLIADLDVECYVGEHRTLAAVAALAIGVYSLVIPGCGLLFLNYRRSMTRWEVFALQQSFFVAGFRRTTWAWEFLTLARKTVVVLIVVFVSNDRAQLYLGGLVFACAAMVHSYALPHDTLLLNRLEGIQLQVMVGTVLAAIVFMTSNSETWNIIALIAAISLNGVLVMWSVRRVITPLLDEDLAAEVSSEVDGTADGMVDGSTGGEFGGEMESDAAVRADVSEADGSKSVELTPAPSALESRASSGSSSVPTARGALPTVLPPPPPGARFKTTSSRAGSSVSSMGSRPSARAAPRKISTASR